MDAQTLVASWLDGRAVVGEAGLEIAPPPAPTLREKFQRAYDWITEHAIFTPYADIEFGDPISVGAGAGVQVCSGAAWDAFVLMPLLNLMTARRLLFIGAPGRGKTTVATLMALLTGSSLESARRSIQHGHPQLSIADLLGSPLPGDMVRATEPEDIRVIWRGWIREPVKIIDEYNRIPTKTQSALLSLMAEGYAEMYEQVIQSGRSAWYLTANDDLGGGTFPVIEALKDRIDVVVRCPPLDTRQLDRLIDRVADDRSPESFVPADLIFTPDELDEVDVAVRLMPVSDDARAGLAFFMGVLDFCRQASGRLEYMSKDTLRVAGRRVAHVCTEDCPLDKQENLCSQTEGGISARAYQTLVHFSQALAWFRGAESVEIDDVRQILPWALHEKLAPNAHGDFFQKPEHQLLLSDRVSWIRQIFDRALQQRAARAVDRRSIAALEAELTRAAAGMTSADLRRRLERIRALMTRILERAELNAPVHAELLRLKGLYYRYQRQLAARTGSAEPSGGGV